MQRLGGVGYISTCTEINFHPIVKPFEMGAYWGVIKRSIFLFDHWMFGSWDFWHFSKKICKKLALGAAKSVEKNFQKIRKIDEKFFSSFLFLLCFIECNVFSRRDIMVRKPILPPLYNQKILQITLWKWCENL